MKRYIYTILFMILLISPLQATHNKQDSLRVFLEQIGEDSATISLIMNSPDAQNPDWMIHMYLSSFRLGYDRILQKYEWYPGWDSLYACKYVDYLTRQIVQDTALYLIKEYFEDAFIFLFRNEYAAIRLLNCTEYAIQRYHSRYGYLIPNLYYQKDWQEKLQFYDMTHYVIFGSEKLLNFDKETNKKYNCIIAESNELSPYYMRFRNLLGGYSDMDLARLTQEQEKELVSILLLGIANGEKKSQMTYAFMLITGQFVERNEELGREILSTLLE